MRRTIREVALLRSMLRNMLRNSATDTEEKVVIFLPFYVVNSILYISNSISNVAFLHHISVFVFIKSGVKSIPSNLWFL